MKRGWIYSGILHATVLALAGWGLPRFFEHEPVWEPAIVVDVVPLSEETNVPEAAKPEPKPLERAEPQLPPPPAPPVEPEPAPEKLPPEAVEPEPIEAEPVVANVAPEELPKAARKPAPEPTPPAEPRVPIPKPVSKPAPADPFASLLKSVEEIEQQIRKREPEQERAQATSVSEGSRSIAVSWRPSDEPLSMTVIDLIRRQVEANWNVPAGVRDAAELVVDIRIQLRPDGRVIDAEIVDSGRLRRAGEENFRAMAESARRAVLKASPLKGLPSDKYEAWRDIKFTFRPPV